MQDSVVSLWSIASCGALCPCVRRQYNVAIREGTIRYAMIDLLKHPPPEFKAVILNHFRCVCVKEYLWGGSLRLLVNVSL
eukprot:scaffold7211_cov21-Tisochrysis_lutea.AAC.4